VYNGVDRLSGSLNNNTRTHLVTVMAGTTTRQHGGSTRGAL